MSARPAPPTDLAGRWLAKFFTGHLAGERAASPRTVASYRDAMKLLLTWFKDAERIPPEKLRLADIDRPRVLRFLDWLETERNCSPATRNQRLAVIKSFCRYTAIELPDHLASQRTGRRGERIEARSTVRANCPLPRPSTAAEHLQVAEHVLPSLPLQHRDTLLEVLDQLVHPFPRDGHDLVADDHVELEKLR